MSSSRHLPRFQVVGCLFLFLSAGSVAAFGGDLVAREPLPREPLALHPVFEQRLVVKFRDDVRARAMPDGRLVSLAGANVAGVNDLAVREGCRFAPLIRLPALALENLEQRAAVRSGRSQPDLAGMTIVQCPEGSTARLLEIGAELERSDRVEWVALTCVGVPPPTDLAPPTPDLVAGQGYLGGNPGVNSNFAWTWNARGANVRVSDCEYGWNSAHEDLNEVDLHLEPGQTIHPDVYVNGWEQHGTAVAGICRGLVNAYGCNGMAPECDFYTYPEYTVEEGFRRETCIANAIASSAAGDVVLLEMQQFGAGGGYAPAEVDLPVWTLVKAGTDAGVIVVGAGGNGNQDLDSPPYAPYLARGNSGAILVGAGSNSVLHSKLSFSTFGSRIDVQAWGQNVRNVGYGDLAYNGSDVNQWYTNGFNGTSSASALVAPSCALIQSFQWVALGTPLLPSDMRSLLVATGWPQQGTGGPIGPAVNIKKALETHFAAVGAPLVAAARNNALRVEPNPFREASTIRFALERSSAVDLEIFDAAGRRVRSLVPNGVLEPGPHHARWDGCDEHGRRVASGVYFVRLQSQESLAQQRVVYLR